MPQLRKAETHEPTRALEPRAVRRFKRETAGAVSVEFALVSLPFIAVMLAIIQIGVLFLAKSVLETATERAARLISTGQIQQNGTTQAQFVTAVCGYLPALFKCSDVMVDVQTVNAFATANATAPQITYDTKGNVTNAWSFNAGASGSIVVLRVLYQFPLITSLLGLKFGTLPNGKLLLMSSAVFQVEPYSASSN